MKQKFKSVKVALPVPNHPVWVIHIRTKAIQMGYYGDTFNSFYDIAGNGIAVSHWAEITLPDFPEEEDLINI